MSAAALAFAALAALGADELPLDAADLAVRRAGAPPLRLRVRIAVEGLPFRHAWRNYFADLWKRLDRDKNGQLDDQEKLGLPWPATAGPLAQADYWKLAEKMTPPLRIEEGPPRRRAASGVFALLDTNGDGDLDDAELRRAPELLDRRDFDDDGLLSPEELLPGSAKARELPVVLLPFDGSVPSDWSGLSAAPDVTLWFELGAARSGDVPPPQLAPGCPAKVSVTRANTFLDAGDLRIDAMAKPDAVVNAYGGLPPFGTLDADQNGYLSETELKEALPPGSFALLDANRDGKVSEREYSDYVVRRKKFLALTVALKVGDEGRELFGALDANGDGKLSRQELARASAVLGAASGAARGTRFPRTLTWEFFRGDASPRVQSTTLGERPAAAAKAAGPAWFQAMDLNGDGVVDRREFLGPPAKFAALDRDGDGVISPAEAAAAK